METIAAREALSGYDGMKVFSATTMARREQLGEQITAWLASTPGSLPLKAVVRQSSGASFHCLSIMIFWQEREGRDGGATMRRRTKTKIGRLQSLPDPESEGEQDVIG